MIEERCFECFFCVCIVGGYTGCVKGGKEKGGAGRRRKGTKRQEGTNLFYKSGNPVCPDSSKGFLLRENRKALRVEMSTWRRPSFQVNLRKHHK